MSLSSEVLADAPVAYYRCGDVSGTVCTDSSGNAFNGAYVSSPTLGVAGLTGDDADTAVTLSGGSSFHEVRSATNAALNFTNNATIEFWYSGTDGPNVRDNTSAGGSGWIIGGTGATWVLRISASQTFTGPSTTPVKDGRPHFIQLKATATTVTLVVDNAVIYTTSARTDHTAAISPWHFGANGTNPAFYNGTYDEVALFNTALSDARLSAHFVRSQARRAYATIVASQAAQRASRW